MTSISMVWMPSCGYCSAGVCTKGADCGRSFHQRYLISMKIEMSESPGKVNNYSRIIEMTSLHPIAVTQRTFS